MLTQSQLNNSLVNAGKSCLDHAALNKPAKSQPLHRVWVLARRNQNYLKQKLKNHIPDWEWDKLSSPQPSYQFSTELGPLSLVDLSFSPENEGYTPPILDASEYGKSREQLGDLAQSWSESEIKTIEVNFVGCSKLQVRGALVGIAMATYSYLKNTETQSKIKLHLLGEKSKLSIKDLNWAQAVASSVNLSRHLVNTPAQDLNPNTYPVAIRKLFANLNSCKVEVWNQQRLDKEGMGMHLAVGRGSHFPPCLIHIKYRPPGTAKQKPIAFVGKGITFDSGGLDLKPAKPMRLMKKDMGGSAVVAATAYMCAKLKVKKAMDFYLAVAENSVSAPSFRPGDVLKARNGKTVEIHNTDAEGRLVVGDALSVASELKPSFIIDVATLTGAIKVGLGSQLTGLFSNDQNLSEKLVVSAQKANDFVWPMPLDQRMRAKMKSSVADMTNCTDGWGGAISAALFLESFVGDCKWAHLDIMAWADTPGGSIAEVGGSGQAVQLFAFFLT